MIIVTLGITIVSTNGRLTCTVKEKRSGEDRHCQFPFIVGWKRYDSCTDFKDPDGKKWCSTKTSNHTLSLHVHVGGKGYWGHCPDDCLEKEVGSCSDNGMQGFECVNPEVCNEMCEIITVRSGPEFGTGCESDKRCSGYNEVCCKNITLPQIIKTTTTLPETIRTTTNIANQHGRLTCTVKEKHSG